MLPDDVFDLLGRFGLCRGENFLPVIDAAFHENRQRGCAQEPVALHGNSVQPTSVTAAGGQQRHLLELGPVITEAHHHREEQLGMESADRETAGFFLVDVLGQDGANFQRRGFPEGAREQNGKIPDIHGIFLLEMDFELILGERVAGKVRPCPVVFAVHDAEQPLSELVRTELLPDHVLPSLSSTDTIRPRRGGPFVWIQ